MAVLSLLGIILILGGWIWLMVVAAKTSGALWAVIVFLLSVVGGLIFCIVKKAGWMQWLIQIVGWILLYVGGGIALATSMQK